ncbi:hypothetical protein AcW1_008031 [Taiwanofungus camphoratus]|nr:hypothetical protein AcW1_008031 [Antrodia cinnamomea]
MHNGHARAFDRCRHPEVNSAQYDTTQGLLLATAFRPTVAAYSTPFCLDGEHLPYYLADQGVRAASVSMRGLQFATAQLARPPLRDKMKRGSFWLAHAIRSTRYVPDDCFSRLIW